MDGNVNYKIEGKSYKLKPHDFVLVDFNAIHKPEIETDKPYERYIIYSCDNMVFGIMKASVPPGFINSAPL